MEGSSPSDGRLLKTVEAEVERPKSPWMPSFQVTTVGRGASPSAKDEQPESQESSALQGAPSNGLVRDETKPQLAASAIETEQALDITSQIDHPAPQVS